MTREKAIEIINRNCTEGSQLREACAMFIPELRESKDERISRKLIDFFSGYNANKDWWGDITEEDILSYLEKQKYDRMKPIYDARESFESALEKAWNDYHNGYENVDRLEDDYVECAHAKGFREGYLFGLEKQKKQSLRDFIDDFPYSDEQKERKSVTFTTEETELNSIAFLEQLGYTCVPPGAEQKPIEDVVKDITKNKESATKFLKSANIMDDNGELAEMYRSEQKLAESEDEVKEDLLYYLKESAKGMVGVVSVKRFAKWANWLEKQKDLFESGRGLYYYDGEKTTYWSYPATEENPYDFAMSQQEKQKEQKPVEWSDEDEEHLKWLCRIIHSRKVHGELSLEEESELGQWIDRWINHNPQPKWDEFDENCLKRAIWYVENPAPSVIKDSRLALWLNTLRSRFFLKPQPKAEWSEEDELNRTYEEGFNDGLKYRKPVKRSDEDKKMNDWLIGLVNANTELSFKDKVNLTRWLEHLTIEKELSKNDKRIMDAIMIGYQDKDFRSSQIPTPIGVSKDEVIDWLESLRPRPHWKPSEEQMGALKNARYMMSQSRYYDTVQILDSLINGLKML